MANTGIERTLTLTVTKKNNNTIQVGYPVVYQGRNAFSFNSNSYVTITVYEMAIMLDADYNVRLTDFKAYVESIESGLDITANLINDSVASRENLTACPI